MAKIITIIIFSWIIIKSFKFIKKIKINSSHNKSMEIKNNKNETDIQDGEYEDFDIIYSIILINKLFELNSLTS